MGLPEYKDVRVPKENKAEPVMQVMMVRQVAKEKPVSEALME